MKRKVKTTTSTGIEKKNQDFALFFLHKINYYLQEMEKNVREK